MSTKAIAKWIGNLGNAIATTINKITITAPENGATLTIADGKTLTVSNDANVSGTNTGDQDLSGLLKTADLVTSVGDPGSDSKIPSEKAVRSALSSAGSISKQESLTVASGDIAAGWKALAGKCSGAAGEKTNVRLTPMGGPEQEYGVDFTAMNLDDNSATVVIWKTSGGVTGIVTPVYPSAGMAVDIEASDILQVYYE